MLHTFDTINDAIEAGYVKAGVMYGSYRGFSLFCCAVGSPPRSDCYRIGMVCENGDEFIDSMTPYFGRTVHVRTSDGLYVMYTPHDYAEAIAQAHAWIDEQNACLAMQSDQARPRLNQRLRRTDMTFGV